MNISSIIFDRSAADLDSCPDVSLPEFAFIGRSNVGKSSLLNMLAGKEDLARVSPVPGFTKLLNFFTVNKTWRLVDLPGYGFAQVARKDSARFNEAVTDYIEQRENLSLVFMLIDSGLTPQAIDLEFLEWMVSHSVPFVIVFTKTDKFSATVVRTNTAAFMERIAPWFEQPPATFTCSATKGRGREELLGVIEATIKAIQTGGEPVADASGEVPVQRAAPAKLRKARPDLQRPW